ncbi:MAG: amino acid ABC transporter substrate-binding protein [Alphaproteobacteria bacterium]|nr:amino acid ABC transporter substrate-binding protein [Alphaproteobacteria bacterium]
MKNLNWKSIVGWGIAAVVVVGIIGGNILQNNKSNGNYRVIGFFPLTGKVSSPGMEMSKGMELAVEKWNSKGGLLGKKIDFKTEDTEADPTKAITIYQRTVAGTDNKPIAIQSIVSGVTLNVQNFAEKDHIPVIGAIGASKFLDASRQYSLRNFASPNIIGKGFAEYIEKYHPNKRIIYFYENSDMSVETKKAFLDALPKNANIQLFDFDPNTTQFRELVLKAKAINDKDVVVITGLGSYLGILIRQLRLYDYKDNIVSDTNAMISGTKDYAGEAMKNVVILDFMPQPDNPYCQEIDREYKNKYGKEVPFNAPYISYQGIDTLLAFYESKGTTDILNLREAIEGFTHDGCLGKVTVKDGELNFPLSFKTIEE